MICCLFVFVYQGISPCNAVPRIAWKQDLTFSCIKTKSRKPLLEIYTQKKKDPEISRKSQKSYKSRKCSIRSNLLQDLGYSTTCVFKKSVKKCYKLRQTLPFEWQSTKLRPQVKQ